MNTTYRKTATIEAIQWFKMGDHPAVVMKSDPNRYADEGIPWCPTMEGGHIVTPGDWIATGVKGEHWPIKADVFAETYTPVDAAISTPATEPQGLEREMFAIAHSCDGYGWKYIDSGSGSDWMKRGMDYADATPLYNTPAHPAPQRAADTRVVTVAQLEAWMGYTSEHGGAAKCLKEIRAIISTHH